MDINSIWELLSSISIGTAVAWTTVVCAVTSVICTGTINLYKIFTKYKNVKDENEEMRATVDGHELKFKELKEQLDRMSQDISQQFCDIKIALNEQNETKVKELRHSITITGENALANGRMSIRQWKSLHEMFNEYSNKYKQNSYVESLIKKVDQDVEIIGRLDEHGNDID